MLAQSFKPAAELGITEPQRDALMKTLVLLETGKLVHTTRYASARGPRPFTGHFNMKRWGLEPTDCGTVACIGGTAEIISGINFFDCLYDPGLHELFYAQGSRKEMRDITPAQAATALRSYLTTGNANWAEAVA
jgi:hypothetical protein